MRRSHAVFAGYGALAVLGWCVSGLAAALPSLRDSLGSASGLTPLYPAMFGVCLLVVGVAGATGRVVTPTWPTIGLLSAGMGIGVTVLTVTELWPLSLTGVVVLFACGALVVQGLPVMLTLEAREPGPTAVDLLTEANGLSSLAGIVGPLTVGAAVAVGLGWRVGLAAVPLAGGAAVAITLLGRATWSAGAARPAGARGRAGVLTSAEQSALRWPMVQLTLSIAVEFSIGVWAATYLYEVVGMSKAGAAAGSAGFQVGLMTGRFVAPRLLGRLTTTGTVLVECAITAVGFGAFWLLTTPAVAVSGLVVAGFGLALLYPIGLHRLIGCLPDDLARAGALGALCSGVAVFFAPVGLAALAAPLGIRAAYAVTPLLLLALVLVVRHTSTGERSGRPGLAEV